MRPESTHRVQLWATWGGLAQFVALTILLALRYRSFMAVRLLQWRPQLSGTSDVVQSVGVLIASWEFLIYPVSFLLLYFAAEGLTRFVAGLVSSQVLPSLPVFLAFRLHERLEHRRQAGRLGSLLPDTVEYLHHARVRIASAQVRPHWNSSITLGLGGVFYEIESKEPGLPGRPFVYVLKPASPGRALRGYEEYDLVTAKILSKRRMEPDAVRPVEFPTGSGPVEN